MTFHSSYKMVPNNQWVVLWFWWMTSLILKNIYHVYCLWPHKWVKYLCLSNFFWRRKWQSTPVLLPGKFHGPRSLVGYIWFMGSQRVRHDFTSLQHFLERTFSVLKFPRVYEGKFNNFLTSVLKMKE